MSKVNFDTIQIHDEVVIKTQHYGKPRYDIGKVVALSPKRFTVQFNIDQQLTFTKDGDEYPRRQGYGLRYYVDHVTDEYREEIRRQKLARKVLRIAGDLEDFLRSNNNLERMVSTSIPYDELASNVKMLEEVYTKLKSYTMEKDNNG